MPEPRKEETPQAPSKRLGDGLRELGRELEQLRLKSQVDHRDPPSRPEN